MSDGAQTTGRGATDAARRARDAGVPVSTISFGTPEGTVVLDGATIPVPPDPDTLSAIARLTEGRAFEAATADELTGVYRSIGRSVQTVEVHHQLIEWFLAAGFILATIAGGLLEPPTLAAARLRRWVENPSGLDRRPSPRFREPVGSSPDQAVIVNAYGSGPSP